MSDSKRLLDIVAENHKKHPGGRPRKFSSPEEFLDAAREYIEWSESAPLMDEKIFCQQGEIIRANVTHPRVMTLGALRTFIGISDACYIDYRRNPEFSSVIMSVEEIIRNQKLAGAAAGIFKENLICREIGLTDKQEHTGANGGPIENQTTIIFKPVTDD